MTSTETERVAGPTFVHSRFGFAEALPEHVSQRDLDDIEDGLARTDVTTGSLAEPSDGINVKPASRGAGLALTPFHGLSQAEQDRRIRTALDGLSGQRQAQAEASARAAEAEAQRSTCRLCGERDHNTKAASVGGKSLDRICPSCKITAELLLAQHHARTRGEAVRRWLFGCDRDQTPRS